MLSLARKGLLSGRQFQIIGASQSFLDNSVNNAWAFPTPYSGFTYQPGDFLLVLVTSNIQLPQPTIPAAANWFIRVPLTGSEPAITHFYGLVLQASDISRGTVTFQTVHSVVAMYVIRGPKYIGWPIRTHSVTATSYTMEALSKTPAASGLLAALVSGSTANAGSWSSDAVAKGYEHPLPAISSNVGSFDRVLKGAGKYPAGETIAWTGIRSSALTGYWLEFFTNLSVGSIETTTSVPYMTSNTAPAGNTVGGNQFAQYPSAYPAFDGNDATYVSSVDDGGGNPLSPIHLWRHWASSPPIIGRIRFKWSPDSGVGQAITGVSIEGTEVAGDTSWSYPQLITSQAPSPAAANTWINVDIPRKDWRAWYGLRVKIAANGWIRINSIEFMVGTP